MSGISENLGNIFLNAQLKTFGSENECKSTAKSRTCRKKSKIPVNLNERIFGLQKFFI